MSPITPIAVRAFTATTCAGAGRSALLHAMRTGRSGLRRNDFSRTPIDTFVGRVDGVEDVSLPAALARWDCRNNRLAWLALHQDGFLDASRTAIDRHGAARVAVLIGTSTSSIGASEEAYARLAPEGLFPPDLRRPQVHTPHSLGGFVGEAIGARGPCFTVATACSSSAKVFAQAERMLRLGLIDAAVVGGVDTLCQSILYGFHALGLVAPGPCRPFDAARVGISLAEAGGFALLQRAGADGAVPLLVGWGESSDAHHMASPHPEGLGAERAALDAVARAGLDAASIDYLNLHGTATPKNDAAEALMVARHFAAPARASSTKGLTGHALGAAGIVEAAIALLALEHGLVPGNAGLDEPDAELPEAFRSLLARVAEPRALRVALSHSFGFGGSNAVLAFAKDRRSLDEARLPLPPPPGERRGEGRSAGAAAVAFDRSLPSVPAAGEGAIRLRVLGIGLWADGLPGWPAARTVLRGDAAWPLPMPGPPPMTLLAPAERRRASASVRVAVSVAQDACAQSGIDPATLLSVFASTHGELGLTDEICRTLAAEPEAMSPTRFHNSVHNAASGYWTIGTGCSRASTAISAWHRSFAAGLFEAAVQAACERRPVLFVAYDAAATGPLGSMASSGSLLGTALVLAPGDGAGARLTLQIDDAAPAEAEAPYPIDNPLAGSLALFAALARETGASLGFELAPGTRLAASIDRPETAIPGTRNEPP